MKNIKNILIVLSLILIITLTIILLPKGNKNLDDNTEVKNTNNGMISIMLQKELGSGDYIESTDTSFQQKKYYFNAKLSKCKNGSKLKYDEDTKIVNITTNKTDKCYAYFDIATFSNVCQNKTVECMANNASLEKSLMHHDSSYANGAGDDSYRYFGKDSDVNNWVCFDGASESGKCQGENDLYRIIGLFKNSSGAYEIKVIKHDYATINELGATGAYLRKYSEGSSYKGNTPADDIAGYRWTTPQSKNNYWSDSLLNTENLNKIFYQYLETKNVTNLIQTHNWKTIGVSTLDISPREFFEYELGIKKENNVAYPTNKEEETANIGLMYLSDYLFAATKESSKDYTIIAHNYWSNNIWDNDWMNMGLYDWTITRNSSADNRSHYTYRWDFVYNDFLSTNDIGVRPAFYLKTIVKLKSGDGTKDNPYRLTI